MLYYETVCLNKETPHQPGCNKKMIDLPTDMSNKLTVMLMKSQVLIIDEIPTAKAPDAE